ncbi:MAG: hypothetical protein WD314_03055 [Trueperaceae bacterium]
MRDESALARHFLAALAYRFHKAVAGAPERFAILDAGHGIRAPLAIVHHINGVLGYGREVLRTGRVDYRHHHPRLDWPGEVEQVHATLADIDGLLSQGRGGDSERIRRLLQGPLSDAMAHVGQLAMLRRMAGSPIPGENFYLAAIHPGRVSEEQPDPVSPDDNES